MDIALLPNQLLIHPRFVEVDMMEVVHHSKYWVWFEEARWDFLKNILEINIKTIRGQDILMPVIDCECKYKKSVLWNEPVVVHTWLELSKASNFRFVYQIFSPSNRSDVYTTASTKHVFIGKDFKLKLKTPQLLEEKVQRMALEKPFAFIQKQEASVPLSLMHDLDR